MIEAILFSTSSPLSISRLPGFEQVPWWVEGFFGVGLAAVAATLIHFLLRNIVLKTFEWLIKRSDISFGNMLFQNKAPQRAAVLIPLIVFRLGIELVPSLSDDFAVFLLRLVASCIILVVVRTADSLLSTFHQLYNTLPMAERRPVKSYVQLVKVFVYFLGGVFIVAKLSNQSPWYFVSGLGAMMAVIMLIFQDTLLSFVAGIQLTMNDLIRVGDWIEMPQFNADGAVIDIALNTVKVQNWDRTVTVIPTNKFLENSFRNYRNMFEGGGRRIKRSIHINTSTIRFLTDKEIDKFSRFKLLEDYIRMKVSELEKTNAQRNADLSIKANARHLTNIGTLRAYIIAYLKNHPGIHKDLTLMVRQLEPTPEGVPIELYTFTNDTRWAYYEGIQADIFDHILAIIPEFGLSVYQRPSGHSLDAMQMESMN